MQDTQRCVIDIEASGFGRHSYPIEIGYVRSDSESWCSLVRPADDWQHWDDQAERVHGIARPCLLQHGRAVADGETGRLAAAGDISALAKGLTDALHDSQTSGSFASAARERAFATWSCEVVLAKYLAVYEQAMS